MVYAAVFCVKSHCMLAAVTACFTVIARAANIAAVQGWQVSAESSLNRFKLVRQKQVSASFCQSYLSVAEKLYNFLMSAAVISHLCANQLLTKMFFLTY